MGITSERDARTTNNQESLAVVIYQINLDRLCDSLLRESR